MYNFEFHAPKTVDDALAKLRDADDPKILSGGQTLIPTLKQRLAMPSDLISLTAIPGLDGIEVQNNQLIIGATERHAHVAASPLVRSHIPALAELAGLIGDPHVRHRGTFGGSVANNDPAADYPAAVLALGATLETTAGQIAADDFFTGTFETALGERDILLKASFPIPDKAGYAKFANPASRYAMVGVFVARFGNKTRVAVTGAGPVVFRAKALEEALSQRFDADAVAAGSVPPEDLISDMHGSADYRAALITVMARRAVIAAQASDR